MKNLLLILSVVISGVVYSQAYTCGIQFSVDGFVVKTKTLTIRNNETLTTSFYHGDDRYTIECDLVYEDGTTDVYIEVYKNGNKYSMGFGMFYANPRLGFAVETSRDGKSFLLGID